MNIGEVLEKSWRIIWKHKVLWIFGILAGCASNSGGVNFNNTFTNRLGGNDLGNRQIPNLPGGQLPPEIEQFLRQLQLGTPNWAAISGIILTVLCLIGILWLVALVLGTFGRIGLVRGAWLSDAGLGPITFGALWGQSALFFWRVLLFNLLLMAVGLVIAAIVIAVAIMTLGIGLCLLLPLLVVVGWFISVWTEETIVAIVGDNLGVGEAIGQTWNLIWKNIGPYALLALILFIGSGIISFVIGLPAILIVVPIVFGAVSQSNTGIATGLIVAAVLFLIYLPIAIVLGGIVQAYLGSAWTLIYRRLTGRGPAPETVTPLPVAPGPVEVYNPPAE